MAKPNPLRRWLDVSNDAQRRRLVRGARTTLGTLRQLAGGYRGRPRTTADLALRIEKAAGELRAEDPALPELRREDFSPACRRCDMAKRCRTMDQAGNALV